MLYMGVTVRFLQACAQIAPDNKNTSRIWETSHDSIGRLHQDCP